MSNTTHDTHYSRRQAVGMLAAGSVTTAMAIGSPSPVGATAPAESKHENRAESSKADFIDAHVHVWTDDTNKYPLATGFLKPQMKPPKFTPEDLFAHAKPLGVTRVALIQMS